MREDGSWLIDGMMPIDEFKDIFEIKYYLTKDLVCIDCSGFVTMRLERIPFLAKALNGMVSALRF